MAPAMADDDKEALSVIIESETAPYDWPNFQGVEEILGYKFNNKELLEEAFTHKSYGENVISYERLEYVGDSVLNLLITKNQYFTYPNQQPGVLTRLRAVNVDAEKLARVTIKHGFHHFLRHKMPLFHDQIDEFSKSILEYPLHSNGLIDPPKALSDIVESTIAAVFYDCGSNIDKVWEVFKELLEPKITLETLKLHPVTELNEMCQKRNLNLKFVDLWKETGTIDVLINDERIGSGKYEAKKEIAHNRAAKDALNNISRVLEEKDDIN